MGEVIVGVMIERRIESAERKTAVNRCELLGLDARVRN